MHLGFPDQVADGIDVSAIPVHRPLLVVTPAVSLDRKLSLGNARWRNCLE
jgi:hypothetical protein